MKVARLVAFVLIGIAVFMTASGGMLDMLGSTAGSRHGACGCKCPMCAAGRCAAALYGGSCPCRKGTGLFVSKQHMWNDALFLMLLAIALLIAFK